MSDEKPPEQPTTKEIPRVDPTFELLKEIRGEVRSMRVDMSLVSNDLGIVKSQVALLDKRVESVEQARARTSDGVRQLSSHDSEQDAQLARVVAEVKELKGSQEVQLAILNRLDKVASNPHIKLVLFALGTAAAGWLAGKGLK